MLLTALGFLLFGIGLLTLGFVLGYQVLFWSIFDKWLWKHKWAWKEYRGLIIFIAVMLFLGSLLIARSTLQDMFNKVSAHIEQKSVPATE